MKLILLPALFLFVSLSETFQAKVIGVNDGDNLIVLTSANQQIKIRLEGIDCPELTQDYGMQAKQALVALCFNKEVRVEKSGIDRYGRTLALLYVDDLCVNSELIRLGMAWHYTHYNHDPELAKLESEARAQKVGLWSQHSPKPPWEFRRK